MSAILLPYNLAAQAQSMMRMPDEPIRTQEDVARFSMNPAVKFRGETAKAAEGWDGDRYAMYANGDRMAMAWLSAWDAPSDAAEFAETYGKVIGRKYGTVTEEPVEGGKPKKTRTPPASEPCKVGEWAGVRWKGTRDGDSAVLVKGDRVLVLERVPADVLVRLAEAAAKTEIVQEKKDTLPAREK